jgi:hypothetical protein
MLKEEKQNGKKKRGVDDTLDILLNRVRKCAGHILARDFVNKTETKKG